MSTQRMKTTVGIAIYDQWDNRSRPISPHWAIVACDQRSSFGAKKVSVYQIRKNNGGSFVTGHTICCLTDSKSFLGVLHVGTVDKSLNEFHSWISGFPASRNGDDHSGLMFWSCEGWAIRVLWGAMQNRWLGFPFPIHEMYDRAKARISVLRTAGHQDGVRVTSLFTA